MKIRKSYLFISILLAALTVSSCYKDDDYVVADYDLTITHYDDKTDFEPYKSFYVRDSVGLISDYIVRGDENWRSFYKPGGASFQIRNKVRQSYIDMGYTEVTDSLQDADIAVNMVVTLSENTSVYYPGYWWSYPGYWYGYYPPYWKSAKYWNGYWGGYYGGYYPWYGGGYSYTYKTGNLMLEMADGDALRKWIHYMETTPNPSPDDPIAPDLVFVWSAFMDGVQDDYSDLDRILSSIDEAYENSPYLKK